jgi:FkbM family methyltransferase
MSSHNSLSQMRYRLEALMAATPRVYSLVLRSFASPSSHKLLFVNLLHRGDVVFDVGANRGIFTSYFSNLVGAEGTVHAFEPSSKTCEILRTSLRARTVHHNVVLNRCAVGDTRERATLRTPASDDGQASLVAHTHGSWSGTAKVTAEACDVVVLDDYVAEQSLNRIDFVKVDVEGAERLVFSGFVKSLTRFRPILAAELCAYWSKDFGYKPTEVIAMLQQLGYDRFDELGKSGRLLPIHSFDFLDNSSDSVDVICSVASKHNSRLSRLRSMANGVSENGLRTNQSDART